MKETTNTQEDAKVIASGGNKEETVEHHSQHYHHRQRTGSELSHHSDFTSSYFSSNEHRPLAETILTPIMSTSNNDINTLPKNDYHQQLIDDRRDLQTINNNDESMMDRMAKRIPLFGLMMSVLSVICFSLCSLIVKILTNYHALEILGIRSCIQVLFFLATTLYYRLPLFGLPHQRMDIFLRALFGSVAAINIYMSYRLIPLADASTIQFSAPVFVFVLAYFILGERITWFHVFTGFLALIGVIFVSKPKFILQYFDKSMIDLINYEGIVLATVAAISTAFAMIMLRKLKNTSTHVVVLWFSVVCSISSFIALYFIDEFIWPQDFRSWAWMVAIGFAGIGDQLFMTLAFKYESAGIVSVSRTLTIVLAFVWDTFLLNVIAHWTSILGSSLVIFAVVLLSISKSMENRKNFIRTLFNQIGCRCLTEEDENGQDNEKTKLLRNREQP